MEDPKKDMTERLIKLIDDYIAKNGVTDYDICKELKIGNGLIGRWRSGHGSPSVIAIMKLSKYLGVSCDYILTGEEYPRSDKDEEVLSLLHKLSPETQRDFIGMMRIYADTHPSSVAADEDEPLREVK